MTEEQIEAAVLKWAVDNNASGLDGSRVILANQNAPQPKRPYVTVLIDIVDDGEQPYVGAPNAQGKAEIVTDKRVEASINVYGKDAKKVMSKLRESLERVRVNEALRGAGIPFIRVAGGFEDVSDVIGPEMEERAQMDVEFRTAGIIQDDLGLIEKVTVGGQYTDANTPDGILNVNLTIPKVGA